MIVDFKTLMQVLIYCLIYITVLTNPTKPKSTLVLIVSSGVTQWVARLTPYVEVVGSSHIEGPRCFLDQETYCLGLVGSRSGLERDITIDLKIN